MPTSDPHAGRSRAVARVLWWTLALNIAVALAKIAYGYHANALSIRADGFHSSTDAANNVIGLFGLAIASRPPDREHPYGHQKFEVLAAALVGVSLLVMAYDVVRNAAERLLAGGAPPAIDNTAFVVLVPTLLINAFVAAYEHREAKRLKSAFLESDASHTAADVLVTIGVIVATVLVSRGWILADSVAALAVAAFVGWAGVSVLRKNFSALADTAQIDTARIEAVVVAIPGVKSTHKIRSRGVPGSMFIDLHIQITPHLDVVEAHALTHRVIDAIKADITGVSDVLVHTEPANDEETPPRHVP